MSQQMRVLVTGGAGFIGSQLALELEAQGNEVVVIDSFFSADESNLRNFKGSILRQDLSESFDAPGQFDVIFHQAAITDPRHDNDKEVYEKNVKGFERLLHYCFKNGVKLIYASTAGLYGNGQVPMKEEQAKEILTSYGQSKLRMDEIAAEYFSKLHVVGLRYFNVFGPNETHKGRPASMIYHLWKQMSEGKKPRIFKWGEQSRDFIYVKDVVRANICALNAPSGIYNVGSGVGTTFNQLVATLNEVMGTHLDCEYFDMPYESRTYQHHTLADTSRAKALLGFKVEWSFKSAVSDYLKWLEKK